MNARVVDAGSRQLSLFFNDTATTEIYTLSLHDALPILFGIGVALAGLAGVLAAPIRGVLPEMGVPGLVEAFVVTVVGGIDRKSKRLNSSHVNIPYAAIWFKKNQFHPLILLCYSISILNY